MMIVLQKGYLKRTIKLMAKRKLFSLNNMNLDLVLLKASKWFKNYIYEKSY